MYGATFCFVGSAVGDPDGAIVGLSVVVVEVEVVVELDDDVELVVLELVVLEAVVVELDELRVELENER